MQTALPKKRTTIRLHQAQADFAKSKALFRGFVGGRGSGKSWAGAYDLIRRAKPGRLYMVASPTYTVLQDTTWRTFHSIARQLQCLESSTKTPPYVKLTTGAEILFRSAEDPEKLRGPNLSGLWLDEASLMAQEAYEIGIACLREAGEQGWLSATFTPKGLSHWTYEIFGSGDKPNTAIFHSRTGDNPFNPPEFHKTLSEQYSGLLARQELDGAFINVEGAEWPAEFFGEHIWFDEWPTDIIYRVMSLDPSKGRHDESGDDSAYVMLGLDAAGVLWADADMSNSRPVEPLSDHDLGPTIVTDGLKLYEQFRPHAWIYESNGFQEYVGHAIMRHATAKSMTVPMYSYVNTDNKQARIRTLGSYFAQRRIRIKRTKGGKKLVMQLQEFPVCEHDDGPDALKLGELMMDALLGNLEGQRMPELLRV